MPTYKTHGVILRRTAFSEADRILTVLTPDHGKISAIAKGVRKQGSKLGSHLEIFNQIELMLAKGKNLDVVTSARSVKRFEGIVASYDAMRIGFLVCEMVNKLTDNQVAPQVYDLVLHTFSALNVYAKTNVTELYFKLHLLDILGYRPDLSKCMASHDEIKAGTHYFFSSERGGFVHEQHGNGHEPKITTNHIKLWRLIYDYPLAKLQKVKGAGEAAGETLPILDEFYNYLFGKRFKSAEI